MNGHAIGKKNNTQVFIFHFPNPGPTSNSAVGLDGLVFRMGDSELNPFVKYSGSIWPVFHTAKVLSCFHRGVTKPITHSKRFERADNGIATATDNMGINLGGFQVAVSQLFLEGANITYMDVGYAGFAGAKTGLLRVPISGWRKNGVRYDNWRDG